MLLEVLLACGLLVVGSLTLGSFATSIRPLAKYGANGQQALLLAKEGIEATRAMRDNDFNPLADGAHGITFGTSTWAFTGTSDTASGFTRTVTVSAFDHRTKKIISTVTGPHASSATLTTALVDIDQDLGMAHYVTFDLSSDSLGDGNRELDGMIIKNIGFFPVVIDKVTGWWGDNSLIQTVKLGNNVWTHNGTGSPSGKQPSGTLLDITNTTINNGQQISDTELKFNGPVTTVNFMVKFTFTDGSNAYVTLEP